MIFDSAFLKRLEALTWEIKSPLRGETGDGSAFRGRGNGVEFADVRPYVPGDDLRYLDWNLLARFGTPMTRRFQEEESYSVSLFLDASPSMGVGEPSKFDFARQAAAALAAMALAGQNRVGGYLFDKRLRGIFPPTRGKEQIIPLLRFLEGQTAAEPFSPKSGTTPNAESDLRRAADDFLRLGERSGIVVILSDFSPWDHFREGIDLLRFQRNDLRLIQIYDRKEANPASDLRRFGGERELIDSETGRLKRVRLTRPLLERCRQIFAESLDAVRNYSVNAGIDYSRFASDDSLRDFLRRMIHCGKEWKIMG